MSDLVLSVEDFKTIDQSVHCQACLARQIGRARRALDAYNEGGRLREVDVVPNLLLDLITLCTSADYPENFVHHLMWAVHGHELGEVE